ncbi:hypothetical protein VitviT2T_024929 [Vitis vinifera]|uniref:Zinc finger CCCH domain-containing protein 48 n=1 Tax=Vitis vinifera TaxID=29760 RepID=A0ABY9DI49_VITVI|nr:hypothetical protein VitviT2T_024929 [Vitis vinifera]
MDVDEHGNKRVFQRLGASNDSGKQQKVCYRWRAGRALESNQFPSGSDKLYTGSKDETVRIWDRQSGQSTGVVNLGGEVGCMISEGPWLFVGIPNVVKAWHTQNNTELSLSGPIGQVYALVFGNDLLFAGVQARRARLIGLVWSTKLCSLPFGSSG